MKILIYPLYTYDELIYPLHTYKNINILEFSITIIHLFCNIHSDLMGLVE